MNWKVLCKKFTCWTFSLKFFYGSIHHAKSDSFNIFKIIVRQIVGYLVLDRRTKKVIEILCDFISSSKSTMCKFHKKSNHYFYLFSREMSIGRCTKATEIVVFLKVIPKIKYKSMIYLIDIASQNFAMFVIWIRDSSNRYILCIKIGEWV